MATTSWFRARRSLSKCSMCHLCRSTLARKVSRSGSWAGKAALLCNVASMSSSWFASSAMVVDAHSSCRCSSESSTTFMASRARCLRWMPNSVIRSWSRWAWSRHSEATSVNGLPSNLCDSSNPRFKSRRFSVRVPNFCFKCITCSRMRFLPLITSVSWDLRSSILLSFFSVSFMRGSVLSHGSLSSSVPCCTLSHSSKEVCNSLLIRLISCITFTASSAARFPTREVLFDMVRVA
mmetsp:Transcript_108063/g.345102  ORF Transcript_108063/g.345102 Transcript_108063/m.345102 type:complete len:236 (-) Transcript_108063:106-813(-)